MIASHLAVASSLLAAPADASLAVSEHAICGTDLAGRQIRCISSGNTWSVSLPDDVGGAIADVDVGPDRLCARTTPSNALLCWSHAGDAPVERVDDVLDAAWGNAHLCALRSDATVECWGNNDHGQLGDGTRMYRATPRQVALPPVIDVSASSFGSCALLEDQTVYCWGDNPAWGDTRRLEPERVSGLENIRQLLPEYGAVTADGAVVAWDVHNDRPALFSTPREVGGPASAMSLGKPSCRIGGGSVECQSSGSAKWTAVAEVSNTAEVRTGGGVACARSTKGETQCWTETRFGLPDPPTFWTAERIQGITNATALAVTDDTACAAGKDGSAWCWTKSVHEVALPEPALELHGNRTMVCSRGRTGIWCWGVNQPTPVEAFGSIETRRFVRGDTDRVCVGGRTLQCKSFPGRRTRPLEVELPVKPDLMLLGDPCAVQRGKLQCWGHARYGSAASNETYPFDVAGLRSLVAAPRGVCGLTRGGTLKCSQPVAKSCETGLGRRRCRDEDIGEALGPIKSITLGDRIGCAVDRAGAVTCWHTVAESAPPARDPLHPIALPEPATVVSAYNGTACAVLQSGDVWCWGDADGPIGARRQPSWLEATPARVRWLDAQE